jgi:carbon-monoxide dehydrogenase iron sulfur subunit
MQVIAVHLDRCTGCKTCELYCAIERGSSQKTLLQAVQESPLPQPRLRVEGSNAASFPVQCRHCLKAPCLDACLSGALVRDPASNMVVIRQDRCIACWTCTMFCPYGVIFPWPEREFALKCDRCTYMEHPVCVEVCPTQAIEVVELDNINEKYRVKRKAAVETAAAASSEEAFLLLDLKE